MLAFRENRNSNAAATITASQMQMANAVSPSNVVAIDGDQCERAGQPTGDGTGPW